MKDVELERQHLAIAYGPMTLGERKVRLWLPRTAEVFLQSRGRRYRHRHSFSDFLLFSVDVQEKIVPPKEP